MTNISNEIGITMSYNDKFFEHILYFLHRTSKLLSNIEHDVTKWHINEKYCSIRINVLNKYKRNMNHTVVALI